MWSKFSTTASLGVLYRRYYSQGLEIYKEHLPGNNPNPNYYANGGALYGLGLINVGNKN